MVVYVLLLLLRVTQVKKKDYQLPYCEHNGCVGALSRYCVIRGEDLPLFDRLYLRMMSGIVKNQY